jgi:hypothetical protein
MNQVTHNPSKVKAASKALLVAAIVALSLSQSSLAKGDPFRHDWIVRMKAEKLQRQFVYRGSSLDKVAKITIDYFNKEDPDNKTPYEILWFNDGKPIGLERKNELKIPAGKATRIEIENKKGTTPETEKAIADAILRISLDAYRKRTAIVSIKVPLESFEGIVAAMNQLNCVESEAEAEESHGAIMNFPIETDENGPSKNLYFY